VPAHDAEVGISPDGLLRTMALIIRCRMHMHQLETVRDGARELRVRPNGPRGSLSETATLRITTGERPAVADAALLGGKGKACDFGALKCAGSTWNCMADDFER
jgi:hypothetical protein